MEISSFYAIKFGYYKSAKLISYLVKVHVFGKGYKSVTILLAFFDYCVDIELHPLKSFSSGGNPSSFAHLTLSNACPELTFPWICG